MHDVNNMFMQNAHAAVFVVSVLTPMDYYSYTFRYDASHWAYSTGRLVLHGSWNEAKVPDAYSGHPIYSILQGIQLKLI